MKTQFVRPLAVLTGFGLGAVAIQFIPAHGMATQGNPTYQLTSTIEAADSQAHATPAAPGQAAPTGGRVITAAERPAMVFRVFISVHAANSNWQDIVAVNPGYPSFEMCELARPELVDSYLEFLRRRYLQEILVELKCARGDDDV